MEQWETEYLTLMKTKKYESTLHRFWGRLHWMTKEELIKETGYSVTPLIQELVQRKMWPVTTKGRAVGYQTLMRLERKNNRKGFGVAMNRISAHLGELRIFDREAKLSWGNK
jgi:hypothetical protein